jgi:hypothetical protein
MISFMETNPHEETPKEATPSDAILNAFGNTQASHDSVEMIREAREKLALEKGISVEDLSPEDLARTIIETPFQAGMALDEIFGAGFMDFMNDTEDQS